jgi:hypothetical protein
MRTDNLVVTALGLGATLLAVVVTVRWWRLPTVAAHEQPAAADRGTAVLDAVRTVAVVASAGLVTGLAVAGLGGRLVMRVLAATSGDAAQGRLTEAGEVVGRITSGGTVGFIFFVGLFAGVLAAAVHLVLRRLLPATAGRAGLVLGLLLLGTVGVSDPLAPENVDFRLLRPTWLAVALVVATGLLLGTTFATVAARLDAASLSASRARHLVYAGLPLAALPSPLLGVAIVYVAARAVWRAPAEWLHRMAQGRAVRAVGAAVVLAATGATAIAAVAILTG